MSTKHFAFWTYRNNFRCSRTSRFYPRPRSSMFGWTEFSKKLTILVAFVFCITGFLQLKPIKIPPAWISCSRDSSRRLKSWFRQYSTVALSWFVFSEAVSIDFLCCFIGVLWFSWVSYGFSLVFYGIFLWLLIGPLGFYGFSLFFRGFSRIVHWCSRILWSSMVVLWYSFCFSGLLWSFLWFFFSFLWFIMISFFGFSLVFYWEEAQEKLKASLKRNPPKVTSAVHKSLL